MRIEAFLAALGGKRGNPEIRLGEASPRQCERRIQRDRAVKSGQGLRAFFPSGD